MVHLISCDDCRNLFVILFHFRLWQFIAGRCAEREERREDVYRGSCVTVIAVQTDRPSAPL